jgi:carbonic anhydrase
MISAESLQGFYRAAGMPPEPPATPGVRFVVLSCMDPRLQPERSLGLSVGDAYVLRNAGGRVSDDTLRSLMVALSELGAREVVVIHHTDCALNRLTNQQLRTAVQNDAGADVSTVDFLPITDLAASVREDVRRISTSPRTPGDVAVVGFVCDTNLGTLQLVVGSPLSQLPMAQTSTAGASPRTTPGAAPPPPPPVVSAPAVGPAWAADTVPRVPASSWEPPPPAAAPVVRQPWDAERHRGRAVLAAIGTVLVIVAILAGIGAVVGNGSSTTNQHRASPTTVPPTAAPTPSSPSASTVPTTISSQLSTAPVYQQPLVTPSADFEPFNQNGATGVYANGGYEVTVGAGTSELVYPATLATVTGHTSEPTTDVGVIATSTDNPNAFYGVDCRLNSSGNQGYFLEVTGGGLASIGDSSNQFAALNTPSPVILRNGQPNVIRGICSGGAGEPVRLTLIVNGVTVLHTTQSQALPPTGTVGIDVDSPSNDNGGNGPATVRFIEFAVRVPDATPPTPSS